jgi:hypothetical protein
MSEETRNYNQSGVDKGLIAMFLRMSPEERLLANDNALRAIVELRDAYTLRVLDLKTLIELKKTSTDPKDKQRLPVLQETLRQLEEKHGRGDDKEDSES